MVRIGKSRGEDTKMSISQEPSVQFTSNFDTVCMRVCPTKQWHCLHGNDVMGCIQVHEMYPGRVFWQKTRKDTTWSVFLSVLK